MEVTKKSFGAVGSARPGRPPRTRGAAHRRTRGRRRPANARCRARRAPAGVGPGRDAAQHVPDARGHADDRAIARRLDRGVAAAPPQCLPAGQDVDGRPSVDRDDPHRRRVRAGRLGGAQGQRQERRAGQDARASTVPYPWPSAPRTSSCTEPSAAWTVATSSRPSAPSSGSASIRRVPGVGPSGTGWVRRAVERLEPGGLGRRRVVARHQPPRWPTAGPRTSRASSAGTPAAPPGRARSARRRSHRAAACRAPRAPARGDRPRSASRPPPVGARCPPGSGARWRGTSSRRPSGRPRAEQERDREAVPDARPSRRPARYVDRRFDRPMRRSRRRSAYSSSRSARNDAPKITSVGVRSTIGSSDARSIVGAASMLRSSTNAKAASGSTNSSTGIRASSGRSRGRPGAAPRGSSAAGAAPRPGRAPGRRAPRRPARARGRTRSAGPGTGRSAGTGPFERVASCASPSPSARPIG